MGVLLLGWKGFHAPRAPDRQPTSALGSGSVSSLSRRASSRPCLAGHVGRRRLARVTADVPTVAFDSKEIEAVDISAVRAAEHKVELPMHLVPFDEATMEQSLRLFPA